LAIEKTTSGTGDSITSVIGAAQSLAESVGPSWGIAILLVIFLFLPKYGVIVNLAELIKEDRIDARKRRVDSERLNSRYLGRTAKRVLPPPSDTSKKG
jgi:hypothetical protein